MMGGDVSALHALLNQGTAESSDDDDDDDHGSDESSDGDFGEDSAGSSSDGDPAPVVDEEAIDGAEEGSDSDQSFEDVYDTAEHGATYGPAAAAGVCVCVCVCVCVSVCSEGAPDMKLCSHAPAAPRYSLMLHTLDLWRLNLPLIA